MILKNFSINGSRKNSGLQEALDLLPQVDNHQGPVAKAAHAVHSIWKASQMLQNALMPLSKVLWHNSFKKTITTHPIAGFLCSYFPYVFSNKRLGFKSCKVHSMASSVQQDSSCYKGWCCVGLHRTHFSTCCDTPFIPERYFLPSLEVTALLWNYGTVKLAIVLYQAIMLRSVSCWLFYWSCSLDCGSSFSWHKAIRFLFNSFATVHFCKFSLLGSTGLRLPSCDKS